jgi:hypothetical protein
MAVKIVKEDTEQGITFEVGEQQGTDMGIKKGFYLTRFHREGRNLQINLVCAIKHQRLKRILRHFDTGLMPTLALLLQDYAEFQKSWVVATGHRHPASFGANWEEHGVNLGLHWIQEDSMRQYLKERDSPRPIFTTDPNTVNSSLWLQGFLPGGKWIEGLVPMEVLLRRRTTLLKGLLAGDPSDMLAWKTGPYGQVAEWQFMRYMPTPHQEAIRATEWLLCDTPEL